MISSLALRSKGIIVFFLLVTPVFSALADAGVHGILSDEKGEPLPFATIYVNQTQSGTTTNQNGFYEIKLAPGKYDIVFQYMGYQAVSKRIQVATDMLKLNVVLVEKSVELATTIIYAGEEDPAYTIMRKAIAKAPFHLNELNAYTAQVYMKGSGRVLDAPKIISSLLEEEGLDSTTSFTSETVTKVQYERPNTYKQQVISTRTSGLDANTPQNGFMFSNFYAEEFAGVISPLSKKAFRYYRFEYVSSFLDREHTINKIHVIPRSKGDGVFEGYLYLVENEWSVHQINFITYAEGIRIEVRATNALVQNEVWLPVTMKLDFTGSFFGVDFEYNYLATVGDYVIDKNPDLDFDVVVIDEKIEKQLAQELERLDAQEDARKQSGAIGNLKNEQVTRKQLRKLLKEYDKEETQKLEEKDVTSNYTLEVDSNANKKDSLYWESVRTVPLDSNEIRGYKKLDSLLVVDQEKAAADSIKKNSFSTLALLTGATFKINDSSNMRLIIPMSFNTVDGYLIGTKLTYNYFPHDSMRFSATGEGHYAISRETLLGQGEISYAFGSKVKGGKVGLSMGKMDVQFNEKNPISKEINTITTLFMEDNFMKLYQKEFIQLAYSQNISPKIKVSAQASTSYRKELENTSNFTIIKYHNRAYTSNFPNNRENQMPILNSHASVISLRVDVKPWQKLVITNGKKRLVQNSSPNFWANYQTTVPVFDQSVTFNKMEFGIEHAVKVSGARRLQINASGGLYINQSPSNFIDYFHFMGNETPFTTSNPAGHYRMLPYYTYSTATGYSSVLTNYQFRKLLATQFTFVRMLGMKENLFANYLWTDFNNTNYLEIGYGLDNIFRFGKIEVVTNNADGWFNSWAVRIGFSTSLSNSISFN